MHVGLDFGTTNSSAAIFDGARITLVPLDASAPNPALMRSALFIGRDGEMALGREAIERYIAGNVGRDIVYTQRYLGQVEMLFAGTDGTGGRDVLVVENVYAKVDANAPGRLFQSLKTALGEDTIAVTDLWGARWTLEALIAAQLREIKTRIERWAGERITSITMGRPVHYGSTSESDTLALERMQRACELAELPEVSLLLEPVGAAYAYAAEIEQPSNALVFDFGGGTLDITVIALDPGGQHTVLATEGVVIGGDQLDRRIVMGTLLPYFGEGAALGPQRRPLPAFLLESLAGWQQIMELATPRTLQIIEQAINTGDKPDELRTLRTLVRENYGVPLYAEVERAKCGLSSQITAEIALDMGKRSIQHTLTRTELEMSIASEARRIGACLDRAVAASGLTHEQIDIVLPTGGSSRIPRFKRLLAERFGAEKLHEQDAFTTVVAGLAIAASRRKHFS